MGDDDDDCGALQGRSGVGGGGVLGWGWHPGGRWRGDGWSWLSPNRYVDRVSELLRQKLKQAELLLAKKEMMSQKRQEALAEQGALEPKLDRLLEKTKELQKLVREGG